MDGEFYREKVKLRTILIPVAAVATFYLIQIVCMIIVWLISGGLTDIISASSGVINEDEIYKGLYENLNVMSILYSFVAAVLAIVYFLVIKTPFFSPVLTSKASFGELSGSLVIMLGSAGLVNGYMMLLEIFAESFKPIENAMNEYAELANMISGDENIVMLILGTAVFVPIAEELFFRGIIQTELRRSMPAWVAIVIQAVVFSLVHGNIIQISYVIFPAIALGLIYEWTRSIYLTIGMHMIFNFAGGVIPVMIGENELVGNVYLIIMFAFIPLAIVAVIYMHSKRKTGEINRRILWDSYVKT